MGVMHMQYAMNLLTRFRISICHRLCVVMVVRIMVMMSATMVMQITMVKRARVTGDNVHMHGLRLRMQEAQSSNHEDKCNADHPSRKPHFGDSVQRRSPRTRSGSASSRTMHIDALAEH